jgi:competence protein ComEC
MLWPIVIAFFAGLICQPYMGISFSLTSAGILLLLLVGAAGFYLYKGNFSYVKGIVSILFWLVGFFMMTFALTTAPTDISQYSGEREVRGEVIDVPKVTTVEKGQIHIKYELSAKQVRVDGSWKKVSGNLVVVMIQHKSEPIFQAGDKVKLNGKIHLPHNYQNPAMFDQVMSLKEQGITATMWAKSMKLEQRFLGFSLATALAGLRSAVTGTMAQAMPPGDAAVLTAMMFGGYDGISSELIHNFAATGIIHILSVSGTHIALVAGAAALLCSLFHRGPVVTAAICAVLMIFYSLLAGMGPAVIRSLFMGLSALLAVWAGRQRDTSQALLLTALLLLLYQPLWIYDLSFLLSFAATGGIVWFFPKLQDTFDFLPAPLALSIAVTIAAELGVLPLVAYYFNNLPLSSLLANLVIVPVIELTVVAALAGAVLTLLLPVFYLLPRLIFVCCSLAVGLSVSLTKLLASWGGPLYLPPFNLFTGLIYYLGLFYLFGYHPQFILPAREVWHRYRLDVVTIGCSLLIGCCLYVAWPQPVTVHFIDVGQGDATLVITPHGRAVLIDTGGIVGENNHFDVGERVVVPYLKHYGVTALDYLILTHGHQDHAGGAAAVATLLTVKQALIAREAPSPPVLGLEKAMHHQHLLMTRQGQKILLDGVSFEVIHAVNSTADKPGNEVSSVIRIVYGPTSFLVTGDLEAAGEQELLEQGVAPVTVLKVGHHGAKNASTADFLAALQPRYAIISVGYENRFGHPHGETLQRLHDEQAKIYRTDENGAIVFTMDGRHLSVETFVKIPFISGRTR